MDFSADPFIYIHILKNDDKQYSYREFMIYEYVA